MKGLMEKSKTDILVPQSDDFQLRNKNIALTLMERSTDLLHRKRMTSNSQDKPGFLTFKYIIVRPHFLLLRYLIYMYDKRMDNLGCVHKCKTVGLYWNRMTSGRKIRAKLSRVFCTSENSPGFNCKAGLSEQFVLVQKLTLCSASLLILSTLGKHFSRGHLIIFFLNFFRKQIWHFMQIVSTGDNLHEMTKPVSWEK